MTAAPTLRARALSFGYEAPLLAEVNLVAAPGTCVALIGANGAGKTTLLKLLGGLLTPDSGAVHYGDADLATLAQAHRAASIGYLPQRTPRATGFAVHEIVLMGLYALLPARGWEGRPEWLAVGRALRRVGASALLRRPFDTLSGGEQRRVLLARALVARPQLLLLDEPLAALDPGFVLEFTASLRALKQEGVGIVVSTHRLSLVRALADTVVVLRNGAIIDQGSPDQVLRAHKLDAAYDTNRFSLDAAAGGAP